MQTSPSPILTVIPAPVRDAGTLALGAGMKPAAPAPVTPRAVADSGRVRIGAGMRRV